MLEPGAAYSNRPEGFGHANSASAAMWIGHCGPVMQCCSITLWPRNGLRDCVLQSNACMPKTHPRFAHLPQKPQSFREL